MVPRTVSSRLALGCAPRRVLGKRAPLRPLYFLPQRDRSVGTRRDLRCPRGARARFRPVTARGAFFLRDRSAAEASLRGAPGRGALEIGLAAQPKGAYIGRPDAGQTPPGTCFRG